MEETFWIKTEDQTELYIKKWNSEQDKTKAIIQLSHGMAEHIGRYDSFARELVKRGYTVYGNDHRGHGQTGVRQGVLGYFAEQDGFSKVVDDVHSLTINIKKAHPHTPIILFGHSMGSFIARCYIQKYSNEVDGVILSGTGYFSSLQTKPAMILSSILLPKKPSRLMNGLAFGHYNKKIKHPKTAFDWLSRDVKEVEKYIKDPLTGFVPTAKFFFDLMLGINKMQSSNHSIRKEIPMLFISGSEDPVGNYEKGIWKSVNLYDKAGIKNITTYLFEEARHEVWNDLNKETFFFVVDQWITKQLS